MKYFLFGIISVVVILGIGFGGYYLGKQQTGNNLATQTPAPTVTYTTPSSTSSPTPPKSLSKDEVRAKIIAAVGSKSYVDLKDLMLPQVVVILQATECCGPMSNSKAIEQMSYLNSATAPWNFDDSNSTIVAIKTNNPDNYGNSILGISTNNYVVAFQLNSENKITKISMAVDFKLLVP